MQIQMCLKAKHFDFVHQFFWSFIVTIGKLLALIVLTEICNFDKLPLTMDATHNQSLVNQLAKVW